MISHNHRQPDVQQSPLWTIVTVRLRSQHAPTVAHLERGVTGGHTKRDAIRCLKRFAAREVYPDIQHITTDTSPLDIAA